VCGLCVCGVCLFVLSVCCVCGLCVCVEYAYVCVYVVCVCVFLWFFYINFISQHVPLQKQYYMLEVSYI